MKKLKIITPGEILLEEFLNPLNISQNKLSKDLDISLSTVNNIVKGKRSISADVALRLGRYFNTTPDLWLGLQNEYDLRLAKASLQNYIEKRIEPLNLDHSPLN